MWHANLKKYWFWTVPKKTQFLEYNFMIIQVVMLLTSVMPKVIESNFLHWKTLPVILWNSFSREDLISFQPYYKDLEVKVVQQTYVQKWTICITKIHGLWRQGCNNFIQSVLVVRRYCMVRLPVYQAVLTCPSCTDFITHGHDQSIRKKSKTTLEKATNKNKLESSRGETRYKRSPSRGMSERSGY